MKLLISYILLAVADGIIYEYMDKRCSWHDAVDTCFAIGGELAKIDQSSARTVLHSGWPSGIKMVWSGENLSGNSERSVHWISPEGCFEVKDNIFPLNFSLHDNCVDTCREHCFPSSYIALQDNICGCLNNTTGMSKKDEKNCMASCPGDELDLCGGPNNVDGRFSFVYKIADYNYLEINTSIEKPGRCVAVSKSGDNLHLEGRNCSDVLPTLCELSSTEIKSDENGSTWYGALKKCFTQDSLISPPNMVSIWESITTDAYYWIGLKKTRDTEPNLCSAFSYAAGYTTAPCALTNAFVCTLPDKATDDEITEEHSESDNGQDVFLYVGISLGLVVGVSVGSIVIVLKRKRCCCTCDSASEDTISECDTDMRNNEISYRHYSSSIGPIDGILNIDSRGMMFLSMDQNAFNTLPLQSNQRITNPSIPLDERMRSTLPGYLKRANSLPRTKPSGYSKRNNSLPRQIKRSDREKEIDLSQNQLCKIHSNSTKELAVVYQNMSASLSSPAYKDEVLYGNTNFLENCNFT